MHVFWVQCKYGNDMIVYPLGAGFFSLNNPYFRKRERSISHLGLETSSGRSVKLKIELSSLFSHTFNKI